MAASVRLVSTLAMARVLTRTEYQENIRHSSVQTTVFVALRMTKGWYNNAIQQLQFSNLFCLSQHI